MNGVITGGQTRMARAFLRWTLEELAENSGVGMSTVRRVEESDGLANVRVKSIQAIRQAFVDSGRIEFNDTCVCVRPEAE